MLQAAITERRHDRRLPPQFLVTSWSDQEVGNAFTPVDITEAYEGSSGGIPMFDYWLESFANNMNVYWGTGGRPRLVEAALHNPLSASGAFVVVQGLWGPTPITDSSETTTLTEVGKQLALVRHYFSLNTTDLSRILLVERPTVYAWLDGKWEPNQENRNRIRKLHQLARVWQEKSKQPIGRFLREPIDGEFSLMDHLVRDPLDTMTVDRVLNALHEQLDQKTRTKRARSVRMIAKQSGFKPLSSAQESEHFDRITRF